MTSAPAAYDRPPLPRFLPSTEAIDAASAKFAKVHGLGDVFEDLLPAAKNNVRSLILDLFTAAADELVVSALSHVTTNHVAYGFSDEQRDNLIFATFATDHGDFADDPDAPTTI